MAAIGAGRLERRRAMMILGSMPQSDEATSALARLERDIEAETDELARRLTDATEPDVRQQALKDLDRIAGGWKGRNAREAVWVELARIEASRRKHGPLYRDQVPSADPHDPPGWGYWDRLLAYGAQEATAQLLAALDREDFKHKDELVELIWALADQLDERAIGPLASLAEDPDPHVAYYATCALINVKSDEVLPILARIAKTSRSRVISKFVGTEASANDPNEIWPVSKLEKVENVEQRRIAEAEWKRRTSQRATPEVDAPTATLRAASEARDVAKLLELLGAAFRENDRKAGDKITRSLEKIGSADVGALIDGLRNDDALVRWVVARLLGDIGGGDVLSALQLAQDDPDESVRDAAVAAIERIESRPGGEARTDP